MRTADMVKSKFWRATDVKGRPGRVLTIADVTEELFTRGGKPEMKCYLWFLEDLKGLQLNRTRVGLLEAAFGPDSVLWTGKKVRLSFDPAVMFGGQMVGGVKLETPQGVIYEPPQGAEAGWGEAPAGSPAARPPAPVWDAKRQMWITPQPPATAAPAPANRPPPPVWNAATGQWETVNPSTGEIGGQMPAGRGLAVLAGREGTPADDGFASEAAADFNDPIPF